MPKLVQWCWQSWQTKNPDWEVVLLTQKNVAQYVELPQKIDQNREIPVAAKSDIIRINLLAQRGGVWVDATLYCSIPLNNWLPKYLVSGFFAFSNPNTDRMLSSWFLASTAKNKLVQTWARQTNVFWENNAPKTLVSLTEKLDGFRALLRKMLQNKPHRWHAKWVYATGINHYFWFHYLFAACVQRHAEFASVWKKTPSYSAKLPHAIMLNGFHNVPSNSLKKQLAKAETPVHKFSLKTELDWGNPETAFGYFVAHHA